MTIIASKGLGTALTRGRSDAARFVSGQRMPIQRRIHESYTMGLLGSGVLYELDALFSEVQRRGWDGFDAAPVERQTYENACRFLESLPLGLQPNVSADSDGTITFEWYRGPRQTFLVSITARNELHYSALLGSSSVYGTEHFIGIAPRRIVDLIRETITL